MAAKVSSRCSQKKDLLVLDDFALALLTDEQHRDLLEIMEDTLQPPLNNHRQPSTCRPLARNHRRPDNCTDAILDRLVHNANKVQLRTKISKRKEELRILFNPAGCSRNSACRSHHSGHLTV